LKEDPIPLAPEPSRLAAAAAAAAAREVAVVEGEGRGDGKVGDDEERRNAEGIEAEQEGAKDKEEGKKIGEDEQKEKEEEGRGAEKSERGGGVVQISPRVASQSPPPPLQSGVVEGNDTISPQPPTSRLLVSPPVPGDIGELDDLDGFFDDDVQNDDVVDSRSDVGSESYAWAKSARKHA